MEAAFGFHDAYIENKNKDSNSLQVTFNTTWGCFITLKFIDVEAIEMIENIEIILESKITKDGSGFCWEVTEFVDSNESAGEGQNEKTNPFVKCKKILWNIDVK